MTENLIDKIKLAGMASTLRINGGGLIIQRVFTKDNADPYSTVEYELRSSTIRNPDGSVVFDLKNVEVPKFWSQVATDILAQKYFRKAGVPQYNNDGTPKLDENGKQVTGSETSVKQVVKRMANCWRYWGEKYGYFSSPIDAQIFEDEIAYMLLHQMAAPNSPQWFNTGLALQYNITGTSQGHSYVDPLTTQLMTSIDAYTHPQSHACFIQSINDDLVNEGGIFDLVVREARVFKYGSGTGSNFSMLRSKAEKLSGGGSSSGLMSFLKIFDRAAGAIKSGGTTRRAAKMVIVNADHPEIEDFIMWKVEEESKVADLYTGSRLNNTHLNKIISIAAKNNTTNWRANVELKKTIVMALANNVPYSYVMRALQLFEQGKTDFDLEVFDTHYEGDAYNTVSGQNSNNTVRITNSFMDKVNADGFWDLTARTNGKVIKSLKARELFDKIAYAAWACADPGLQFDDTIQEWHTCAADGKINATNPCFTGDTKITTSKGIIEFKEIIERVNKGESFRVYTDNLTSKENPVDTVDLTSPTQFMITGLNPVYKITFSNGMEVKCTQNHKIYTQNRGMVEAKNLTKEDKILNLTKETPFIDASYVLPISSDFADYRNKGEKFEEIYFPQNWTDDFAELIGHFIGDGGIGKTGMCSFIYGDEFDKKDLLTKHQQTLSKIFEKELHVTTMNNGTLQLRTTRLAFTRFLNALGVQAVYSEQKRVPKTIFQAPTPVIAHFMRGLFSADGTVVDQEENGTRYVGLGSVSFGLLQDVQLLLTTFGIHSKIYKTKQAGKPFGIVYKTVGGVDKNYYSKQTYDLRISGKFIKKFADLIGFSHSKKQEILEQITATREFYNTDNTIEIETIEPLGVELTYNLTEPKNHSYIANGVIVANCSEYVFLDDTACNLASINLIKFLNEEKGELEVEKFLHATRLWTIVLEITVLMAQFPSKEIAMKSYDYRTLGLGYANLGTLLMVLGIPYDSDKGRAIAGAITAIMCGESYATSSEMAKYFGSFRAYERNSKHMLKVIRNHRLASYNAPVSAYEGLSVTPVGIDPKHCPEYLAKSARQSWDKALIEGEKYGYRNAQVTVIAPTGTIGLVMDCDTTGVEPDFAIVKFKKLAGGGYFKIVNNSVKKALTKLSYSEAQIKEIEDYCRGHGTLLGCPHVNFESLRSKGFTDEKIQQVEKQMSSAFDISFVFNKFTLGEDFCVQKLNLTIAQLNDPKFSILSGLGFSDEQISEANNYVCGTMTIENAPHLKEEHYAVFDCANKCGKYGKRFIHYDAHLKMMAAVQPFISGSISKTINMPNEAPIEEVKVAYTKSWKYMLKAIALYRDGSKLSQPLNSVANEANELLALVGREEGQINEQVDAKELHEEILVRGQRRKLPTKREGFVQEARIAGHKLHLRTGEYPDGELGEIFIDMYKEGAGYRSILNCFAIAVSKGLQYGVPLEEFVETFAFTRFEPSGAVMGDEKITNATSMLDYVFRVLERDYLQGGRKNDASVDEQVLKPTPSVKSVEAHTSSALMPKISETKSISASMPMSSIIFAVDNAKLQGYTGESCGRCSSMKVKRNGACSVCVDCGETTGCS